jgi:hypothetical protein
MIEKIYYKIKILIAFLIFLNLIQLNLAFSQNNNFTNDLLISWQALNYAPPKFKGKILPTSNSIIEIGFEFIQNGKIIDLSKNKIYWYINSDLVSNSPGTKQISVIAPNIYNDVLRVRVELPDFNVLKTIEIPVVKPKIVINAPFPNNEVHNNNFEVYALPYFFNPKDNNLDYININWFINELLAKPSKDDLFKTKIKIEGDNPTNITIGVYAENSENEFERSADEINLKFIK